MTVEMVELSLIHDNPYQPRSSYPTNKIAEIAYSIEQIGLIHTPKARRVNEHFQIAEGHLRKRAYIKLAKKDAKKWGQMPIDIQEITDELMALIALEENIRRQDITPLDQARAIDSYMTNFDTTETALAKKLNMTQGNVSNMRRVLKCPEEVLQKICDGKINFTMARELLIFQGKAGQGQDETYNRKTGRYDKTPMDDAYLMLKAVKSLRSDGSGYGPAATVDGIKKAIYDVAYSQFYHLEKTSSYDNRREPLFDTTAAGCMKCEHMLKAYETKKQVRHFCTEPKCWEKKQEAHKKKQAALATKKMEKDIAKRIAAAEGERTGVDPAVEESPVEPDPTVAELNELEEDFESEDIEDSEDQPGDAELFNTIKATCQGCINTKMCDETGRRATSTDDGERYYCQSRVTKETYSQQKDKAIAKMPEGFKEMVTDQAGSRAEVLDLRELRLGSYRDELKTGFALLSGMIWTDHSNRGKVIDLIDTPEECLERCTKGFHYAYDSGKNNGAIEHVCAQPKCLAQKKAAFTRAKNATGQAKKKAEVAAIREAVQNTTSVDKPRLILVLMGMVYGNQVQRGYYSDEHPEAELAKALGITLSDRGQQGGSKTRRKELFDGIVKLTEEDLAKAIVSFTLSKLTYQGDIKEYRVQTTEVLNLMGIGINVSKPKPLAEVITKE